jgi:hypothetical protein
MIDLPEHMEARKVPLIPREAGSEVPLTPIQLSFVKWIRKSGTLLSQRLCIIALRLSGPLNASLLDSSIAMAVARHESLRTRIVEVGGILRQHIDQPLDHYLEVVNLHEVPLSLRAERVERLLYEFIDEEVDLSVGPLLAAKLFKLSSEEHVVVLAMDHIITDGFSKAILNKEIWTNYHGAVRGLAPLLPRLQLQYGDYATWLHKNLGSWRKDHEAYWQERVAGAPTLKLPIRSPDTSPMKCSCRVDFIFGKPLTDKLRELATGNRMMMPIVVLAVYLAAMSRWYGEKDLPIWFVSHGRYLPVLRNMLGFLAHELYLRIGISCDDSFLDLLRRVNMEFRSANEHRDFGWIPHVLEAPTTDLYFNWGPWFEGEVHDGSGIKMLPLSLRRKWRGLGFFDETPAGIVMYAHFAPECIAPQVVKRFGEEIVSFAHELAENPLAHMEPFLNKIKPVDPGNMQ